MSDEQNSPTSETTTELQGLWSRLSKRHREAEGTQHYAQCVEQDHYGQGLTEAYSYAITEVGRILNRAVTRATLGEDSDVE